MPRVWTRAHIAGLSMTLTLTNSKVILRHRDAGDCGGRGSGSQRWRAQPGHVPGVCLVGFRPGSSALVVGRKTACSWSAMFLLFVAAAQAHPTHWPGQLQATLSENASFCMPAAFLLNLGEPHSKLLQPSLRPRLLPFIPQMPKTHRIVHPGLFHTHPLSLPKDSCPFSGRGALLP